MPWWNSPNKISASLRLIRNVFAKRRGLLRAIECTSERSDDLIFGTEKGINLPGTRREEKIEISPITVFSGEDLRPHAHVIAALGALAVYFRELALLRSWCKCPYSALKPASKRCFNKSEISTFSG